MGVTDLPAPTVFISNARWALLLPALRDGLPVSEARRLPFLVTGYRQDYSLLGRVQPTTTSYLKLGYA